MKRDVPVYVGQFASRTYKNDVRGVHVYTINDVNASASILKRKLITATIIITTTTAIVIIIIIICMCMFREFVRGVHARLC